MALTETLINNCVYAMNNANFNDAKEGFGLDINEFYENGGYFASLTFPTTVDITYNDTTFKISSIDVVSTNGYITISFVSDEGEDEDRMIEDLGQISENDIKKIIRFIKENYNIQ